MIVTTLIVCFLLSFLPLVIGTFSLRYSPNIFSKAILALSSMSFLLGLAQFGLILGTSYRLFSPAHMKQAGGAIQYVSIIGGTIMIVAGFLWVGYFRLLIKAKKAAAKPVRSVRQLVEQTTSPRLEDIAEPAMAKTAKTAPRKRREKPEPEKDWFSDELPAAQGFKLAAVVAPKKAVRIRKAPKAGTEE